MHLSRLTLNLRLAGVRQDLANPYEMHSTLSWVFAAGPTEKPSRFLWRLEPVRSDGLPVVLVQSYTRPCWDALEERLPGYLAKASVKDYGLLDRLRAGHVLRFRLRANPTVTRQGKRQGLRGQPDQIAWLRRQGERHGFLVLACTLSQPGLLRARQRKEGGNVITVQVVTYDGYLRVEDPALLRGALELGLGHAKALGLGLLSVAPARE
ncbi:MAG: type I-E CRISPR-associated protein Cas6/Cse3/CasE [bacterium]|nr:type I-E CRISPR-associated protein Cas6/Cse3/CasE [bacterium]